MARITIEEDNLKHTRTTEYLDFKEIMKQTKIKNT